MLLFLTAAIWGFAFVAQRKGMEYLDPLLFNAIRFALGALVLAVIRRIWSLAVMKKTWMLGLVLFIAATFQQYGMIWTTAANAGFITGLYVVFVPLIGIYRKQEIRGNTWISVLLALAGLYLISNQQSIRINFGNALVLVSAVFWAIHVQLIDKYARRFEAFELALGQFVICSVPSFCFGILVKLLQDKTYFISLYTYKMIFYALVPLLYGGVLSVGVAYSLQVYAQRKAQPSAAALILCSESIFALLGGWLILREKISISMLLGASILLLAMILNLLPGRGSSK